MFSAFQTFGRLGAGARAVSAAWSPLALWPLGASSPGLWIDPPTTASMFQDSAGTTAISAIGTVADSANPVGLVLDRKGGATALADPGIHLLQATATSRPVVSARVNLLTYSEDFSNAKWSKLEGGGVTLGALTTAPDGTNTAQLVTYGGIYSSILNTISYANLAGDVFTAKVWLKRISGNTVYHLRASNDSNGGAGTAKTITDSWAEYAVTSTMLTNGVASLFSIQDRNASNFGTIAIWHPQTNRGSTALPYQRVTTDSDYDASAGPTYLKFDGVDDGLASATFAAGTLTSSMDCLIAVRRDSAGKVVAGLFLARGTYFGAASSGGVGASNGNVGSPTVWVDGTQLSGGTSVTEGTLHTALTVGAWHILEIRGLDLSAWTIVNYGNYGLGYNPNGALGDILLYPSTTPTADKDAARQWLADYYGVTLA